MPWIGEVPVLGALFRSNAYKRQETDLVIIVTPHLVRPLDPGQRIATPLDATRPPNDVDLFVNGRTEVANAESLANSAASASGQPLTGHILDLPELR